MKKVTRSLSQKQKKTLRQSQKSSSQDVISNETSSKNHAKDQNSQEVLSDEEMVDASASSERDSSQKITEKNNFVILCDSKVITFNSKKDKKGIGIIVSIYEFTESNKFASEFELKIEASANSKSISVVNAAYVECFYFARFIPVVLYREEKSDGNYQYTIGYIESFSGSSEFFSMESFTFSSGFQEVKILDGPTILFYDSSNKSFYCGRFDEGNKYKSSTIKLPNELYKILFCGNIKGTDVYPSQTSILFSADKELSFSKPLKTQDPSDSHSDSTRKLAFYLFPISEKTLIDESKSFMRWNLIPDQYANTTVCVNILSIANSQVLLGTSNNELLLFKNGSLTNKFQLISIPNYIVIAEPCAQEFIIGINYQTKENKVQVLSLPSSSIATYEGHSILLVGDLLGYGGDQFLLLANNDNSSLSDFLIIDGKSLVSQSGRMGEQSSTLVFAINYIVDDKSIPPSLSSIAKSLEERVGIAMEDIREQEANIKQKEELIQGTFKLLKEMTLGSSQSQNKASLLGLVPFIPAESSSSSIKGRSSNINSQETSNILSLQSMQKFYSNQTYSVSLSILNLSSQQLREVQLIMFSNNCQIKSQSKLLNQDGDSIVPSNQSFSISCIGEFSYPESLDQSDITVNLVVEGKIGSAIFWEVVGIVVVALEERIGGSLRSEKPIFVSQVDLYLFGNTTRMQQLATQLANCLYLRTVTENEGIYSLQTDAVENPFQINFVCSDKQAEVSIKAKNNFSLIQVIQLIKKYFSEDVHGILNLTDEKCLSAIHIFISALNREILFAIDGLKQFVVPRETKPNLKEYVKFRADYHLLQSVTDACFTNLQMLTQAVNVVSCSECSGIFK